jgi:hypothetical protein
MSDLSGVLFVPPPVQRLGHRAKLDQEVARQVLGVDLASLFIPKPDQRRLVLPHDDPGVRPTYERAAMSDRLASKRAHPILPANASMSREKIDRKTINLFPAPVNRISIKEATRRGFRETDKGWTSAPGLVSVGPCIGF